MRDGGRRGKKPSERVIHRVADEKEVSVTELAPLYEVVDPDALDNLFRYDAPSSAAGRIQFEYEGHTVIVHSSGRVGVSETVG